MVEQQVFTRESLASYDGKDGRPTYVAFAGKVYDVTGSLMWEEGEHEGEHLAGADLTEAMEAAPHFADELDGFPVVGSLAD
jgi:predicted heme/steroid binding protein